MARITKSIQKQRQTRFDAMLQMFREVAEKHNLKEEVVIEIFKKAVRNAYARQKGGDDVNVDVALNEEMLDFEAQLLKTVVAHDDDIQDDALEISLEEAKSLITMRSLAVMLWSNGVS